MEGSEVVRRRKRIGAIVVKLSQKASTFGSGVISRIVSEFVFDFGKEYGVPIFMIFLFYYLL